MNYNKIKFNHIKDLQIRFNDIDMLGHVNNISVQEFFDLGRITYLTENLGKLLDSNHEHLVIASYNTNFYAPILFEEKIEVRTKVYNIGNKSLKMFQGIFDKNNNIKAANDCILVGFDMQSQKSISIPNTWRDSLSNFEKGDIIQDKVQ